MVRRAIDARVISVAVTPPPATAPALAEQTALHRSIVREEVEYFRGEDVPIRVVPRHNESSAVIGRMQACGPREQMPPLGMEAIDPGLELASRWIEGFPETGGG
jgi:hypothetical protein